VGLPDTKQSPQAEQEARQLPESAEGPIPSRRRRRSFRRGASRSRGHARVSVGMRRLKNALGVALRRLPDERQCFLAKGARTVKGRPPTSWGGGGFWGS